MKSYYVYIMANKNNTALYVGFTSELVQRVYKHKNEWYEESHTAKYALDKLVYFEIYDEANTAIAREKWLKKAYKKTKLKLINEKNPLWNDLYEEII